MTADNGTGRLTRRARVLSYVTVGYNIIEGIVSIAAGIAAGSIALAGFGLDSAVESLSGLIMVWRFSPRVDHETLERRETRALKLVGASFFVFAAYVLFESAMTLWAQERPEPSLFGIIIAAVSCITMPVLYVLKRDTGRALGSRALIADSKETLACLYLSISLFIGLGLNYVWGLWWADPVTGLVIAWFLYREGMEAFEGEEDDDDD